MDYDIIIIGGGPAGMAAAIEAKKSGEDLKILLIEKEDQLGGTLNQCIHCGFGNDIFSEYLTGSEFAQRFVDMIDELNIEFKLETTVLSIEDDKSVRYVNPVEGVCRVTTKAVIIATGIRELFSGNISIPLNKFAGIYTVGTVHKFINNQGYLPGKNIVILGTSETSLVVARRLIVEGAKIKAIIESTSDLRAKSDEVRKIVDDFNIPVLYGYRVNEVIGNERIEELTISKIEEQDDEQLVVLKTIECDSLLISVNFLPDKKLADKINLEIDDEVLGIKLDENLRTNTDWVFAAGGVVKGYGGSDKCAKQGKDVGKIVVKYCNEIKKGIN